jgi:hypothetical protein
MTSKNNLAGMVLQKLDPEGQQMQKWSEGLKNNLAMAGLQDVLSLVFHGRLPTSHCQATLCVLVPQNEDAETAEIPDVFHAPLELEGNITLDGYGGYRKSGLSQSVVKPGWYKGDPFTNPRQPVKERHEDEARKCEAKFASDVCIGPPPWLTC